MKNKTLFILIGPKGSGKTYIGWQVQKHHGIHFLRVEDIALQVKKERKITNQTYIEEVFAAIEREVRYQLLVHNSLMIESTGLTDSFDNMLSSLKKDFQVYLIKVSTDLDTCLQRVKLRDASIHMDVSDAFVNKINADVLNKSFIFDGIIENTNTSSEELISQLDTIFGKLNKSQSPLIE